jgi:hypothetical protein
MIQTLARVEKVLAKWGPGDRSTIPMTSEPTTRQVVAPGVGINVPFVGLQIGGGNVVVTEEVAPQLQRRRLHVNSHGSKRSLERELAAVKVAMNYLAEDAGVATDDQSLDAAQPNAKPVPAPPEPQPDGEIVPPRKPATPSPNPPKPDVNPK